MTLTGASVVKAGQGRFDDEQEAGEVLARVWSAVRGYWVGGTSRRRPASSSVDGSGAKVLQLPTLALSDVKSVIEDGVELAPSSYSWSRTGVLRKRVGCWTPEYRGVVAVVDHGYDELEDVEGVVLQTAVRSLIARADRSGSASGRSTSDLRPRSAGSVSSLDYAVLDKYLLPGRRTAWRTQQLSPFCGREP